MEYQPLLQRLSCFVDGISTTSIDTMVFLDGIPTTSIDTMVFVDGISTTSIDTIVFVDGISTTSIETIVFCRWYTDYLYKSHILIAWQYLYCCIVNLCMELPNRNSQLYKAFLTDVSNKNSSVKK